MNTSEIKTETIQDSFQIKHKMPIRTAYASIAEELDILPGIANCLKETPFNLNNLEEILEEGEELRLW